LMGSPLVTVAGAGPGRYAEENQGHEFDHYRLP